MRLRGTRYGERYGDVLGEGICQAGACNDNDSVTRMLVLMKEEYETSLDKDWVGIVECKCDMKHYRLTGAI